MIFSGGSQAQSRGGDIRRLVIHDSKLSEAAVSEVFYSLANDSPVLGGRANRIQSVYRGFISRLKAKREREANLVKDGPTASDTATIDVDEPTQRSYNEEQIANSPFLETSPDPKDKQEDSNAINAPDDSSKDIPDGV